MLKAITRGVSPSLARCELTHLDRAPIDVAIAAAQHAHYELALTEAACELVRLPASAEHPDCVFVEDIALVLDEIAVVTRPGAASRRGEIDAIADELARHRELRRLEAPATLDGGDVLVVGRSIFVGRSSRTNAEGVTQLRAHLSPLGYEVLPIQIDACLHLKSAVSAIADGTLLFDPAWIDRAAFARFELVEIDPREPGAANALRVGSRIIYPSSFPRTRERLEARGLDVIEVDVGELQKAEGAVTCCSLIFAA